MQVIVCVDDNGGMMFNKRRQSRDRVLCEYVMRLSESHQVYMSAILPSYFQKMTGLLFRKTILRKLQEKIFALLKRSL